MRQIAQAKHGEGAALGQKQHQLRTAGVQAFANEGELVEMIVDAAAAGTDGLWMHREPGPLPWADGRHLHFCPTITSARGGSRHKPSRVQRPIKVLNGNRVKGTLPSAHPGWMKLRGLCAGFWLPTRTMSEVLLHDVVSHGMTNVLWMRSREAKTAAQLAGIQSDAEATAAHEAQLAAEAKYKLERQSNTEARYSLDQEGRHSSRQSRLDLAAVR